MKALVYLNFFINRFYAKKDSDAWIYSMLITPLLITFNLMTIYFVVNYIYLKNDALGRYLMASTMIVTFACNYILFYKENKHQMLFEQEIEKDRIAKKILCTIYIVFSFVSFFLTALVIRYLKFGRI